MTDFLNSPVLSETEVVTLGESGEAAYQQLFRTIRLGDDFSLLIVEAVDYGVRQEIVRRLSTSLTVERHRFSTEDEFREILSALLSSRILQDEESIVEKKSDVLLLESVDKELWETFLPRLNERRNHLIRTQPNAFLLLGGDFLSDSIRESASDLWSIRSVVLRFPVLPSQSATPLSEPVETKQDTEVLTVEELQALIAKIGSESEEDKRRKFSLRLRLANALNEQGKFEEAEAELENVIAELQDFEAVEIEAEAFLLQGHTKHKLGKREEGLQATQEALEWYRQLAKERPDAFLSSLAGSLNNLGAGLSELGRREEALAAAQEAVEIQRQLVEQRPDAFLPDLATSLNNLGAMLSSLGRRKEALAAIQEAVEIQRQLAEQRPKAFLPDLANSLNSLGADLSLLGRRKEALAVTQEAVEIQRQLAEQRPEAFLPELAGSLNNLGVWLSKLERKEEALQASEEATHYYTQLVQAIPAAFFQNFAISLRGLFRDLNALGIDPFSNPTFVEANRIYEELREEFEAS
jgi:tetratricopeptide (TPR) repeat protein